MIKRLRLLLLEDNLDDAALMQHELEQAGFAVEARRVETREAFTAHLTSEIDLILSDHDLPEFDALQALALLKKQNLDIPFIIVSGTIREELAIEAMKRGAADYLLKDRLTRLGAAVERALEERQLRQEKQQAHHALKRSEAHFRTLIENALDIITVLDEETTIRYESPSVKRILGYEPEEMIGLQVLDFVHPDDVPTVLEAMAEALAKQGVPHTTTCRFRHKDGSWRMLGAIGQIVVDDEENLRIIVNSRDITEQEQTRKASIEAKEKAEEMNRLKDAFLANMSHEIRTPLAAIIGFADLVAAKVAEPQRRPIHQIRISGQRLLNTLNSVLDLSMLEAGTLTLDRDVLDVAAEVQQTVRVLHPLAREKGLDVQVQLPASKVEALLDRTCLGRILNNLVGNAIKFTEQGGVTIVVRAAAEQVEIAVRDTGIGISEAFVPRLFEAFKQESTGLARSYEGTGLGLAITNKLVELMEGEITVESRKGAGSRFTVAFPRLVAQPEASTKTPDDGGLLASGKRLPWPTRVLAVDDNPAMLYLLERFLEEVLEVPEVDAAGDEETALALARLHRYDVMLLDINLGVIRTGVDVLHELRQLPAYATVPAVAVTAYALPGDRERFLEAGFDAYLGKPFTEEELRQVLIEVLPTQNSDRPYPSLKSVG